MGRKPELSQEEQRLRQATRDAHEAAQHLRDAIRDYRLLEHELVTRFEEVCDREIRDLSNQLQREMNRQSARLNDAVENARAMIIDQLAVSDMEFDEITRKITVHFTAMRFDDTVPLPYPELTDRTTAP